MTVEKLEQIAQKIEAMLQNEFAEEWHCFANDNNVIRCEYAGIKESGFSFHYNAHDTCWSISADGERKMIDVDIIYEIYQIILEETTDEGV